MSSLQNTGYTRFLEYTERIGMNDIESDVNTGIRSTVKMYD